MTSRERILAAAKHEPVDTVPISPRLGFVMDYYCGHRSLAAALHLKEIYDYDPHLDVPANTMAMRNPYEAFTFSKAVNVKIKIHDYGRYRLFDRMVYTPAGKMHEVIKVPNPDQQEYGSNPNPQRLEFLVKEPGDLDKLTYCIPPLNASFASNYRNWEKVVGEEGLVRCRMFGPVDNHAGLALPLEELMVNYLVNKEFSVRLVGLFREQIFRQTKLLLEEGVRVFSLSYYWCSLSAGWSPRIFEEWFLPIIKSQVELIHQYDGLVFYYDDGKLMNILEYLIKAEVDVVETCTPPPMEDFDLRLAKRKYGDKITFMGYVDLVNVLLYGTVQDVRKQVSEACSIGGKNSGFILGTSDSIREGTPLENIEAYFRYGREYGQI